MSKGQDQNERPQSPTGHLSALYIRIYPGFMPRVLAKGYRSSQQDGSPEIGPKLKSAPFSSARPMIDALQPFQETSSEKSSSRSSAII